MQSHLDCLNLENLEDLKHFNIEDIWHEMQEIDRTRKQTDEVFNRFQSSYKEYDNK